MLRKNNNAGSLEGADNSKPKKNPKPYRENMFTSGHTGFSH